LFSLLLVTLFNFSIVSCSNNKPTSKPQISAEKEYLLTDFENTSMDFSMNAGSFREKKFLIDGDHTLKAEAGYSSEQAKSGKYSLKCDVSANNWGCVGMGGLHLPAFNHIPWEKVNKIKFFVYGKKTGAKCEIIFEDFYSEQFSYFFEDNFVGWKEIIIPFESFSVRTRWQPPYAEKDGYIDTPIKWIFFHTAGPTFSIYVDDIYFCE